MAITALNHAATVQPHHDWARRLVRFTMEHFLLLPIGGLIALVWANTGPESYFSMAQALRVPVNDIGMALFFALVAQEVVEEVIPGGALHTWRRWTLPVMAAAGATIGAATVYLAYINWGYELVLWDGWAVAAAVDVTFAYLVVKSIFGRHPAVPFLLLVAISANVFCLAVIATRESFADVRPGGTALMALAIGIAFVLRRWKVRTFWPYLLLAGPVSWWALYLDGLPPALALVPIVPFLTHAPRSLEFLADAPHGAHDSPGHIEHVLKDPVHIVLFLFGLVNAGVLMTGYGTGTWALLAATLVGKPAGLMAGIAAGVLLGLHLPRGLHWRDLAVVAPATAGVFAFGLFFATAVFPTGPILGELKIGAIASGVGVPLAFAFARLLHAGRFGRVRRRRVH